MWRPKSNATESQATFYHFVQFCLAHISLASFYGSWANSTDPDQTRHNVVSDQNLHCLLTEL